MRASGILALALLTVEPAPAQAPPELARAPYYSRSDWLEESLRTTDLIVEGTPEQPETGEYGPARTSRFDIERILFGAVDRDLYLGGTTVRITAPYRFRWGVRGLYILFYRLDTYLHVAFENGRVSAIHTGFNGLDYEFRR